MFLVSAPAVPAAAPAIGAAAAASFHRAHDGAVIWLLLAVWRSFCGLVADSVVTLTPADFVAFLCNTDTFTLCNFLSLTVGRVSLLLWLSGGGKSSRNTLNLELDI